MKFSSKRVRIILIVSVIAIATAVYMVMHMNEESTDDATIEAHVVTISPKVSGYVKVLSIVDNQRVKAGDVLLEIDPSDYIIRRDHAKAVLDASSAQVLSAQANLEKAQSDLKRIRGLSDQARSKEQVDQVTSVEKASQAVLDQLNAQVKQSASDLAQAEKDLADTKVTAPQDGRITKRGVEQGDYIQTGQQLGYVVGNDYWVIANYKETQLKHMKVGQPVSIEVDAYPSVKMEGKVESIQSGTGTHFSSFPPENATGNYVKIVQRVPVKILFTQAPDANLPLGPGMSVVPVVNTK